MPNPTAIPRDNESSSSLFARMESEISNYRDNRIELSEGVFFSQDNLIKRIYKFKNRDLMGTKINEDLSYNYYFDIISPRADSETKNLRFDTKNILVFSQNPEKDFAAVFISNAVIRKWMSENGEDDKLKAAVEEYTANGNIGFKRVGDTYEIVDSLNTVIANQVAETVNDTDVIERHVMTASQINAMKSWNNKQDVIDKLGNKTFTAAEDITNMTTTSNRYEIWEFTGEVNEKEYNKATAEPGEQGEEGDPNKYFLAKVIVAGLRGNNTGEQIVVFAEKLTGKMDDWYKYAHRGKYEGRFWRVGMYELLFDHQIRANQIGNDLASGLEWASKVIFQSTDSSVLQNIRADMDNGDVVIADDLKQLDVRMHAMDQLIADWNRLMSDANSLSHISEVVQGDSPPSGTPFRLGALIDQNAGKMFVLLRQKITLSYRKVFKDWVLKSFLKDMSGEDIYNLTGEVEILDQLREIAVDNWYVKNLVTIGPHTSEQAEAIKAEKLDELRRTDMTIKNSKEIWKSVFPRLFITITGENSDLADNVTDLVNLMSLEQNPERINFLLDRIYKIRGIPVPPPVENEPPEVPETQLPNRKQVGGEERPNPRQAQSRGERNAAQPVEA